MSSIDENTRPVIEDLLIREATGALLDRAGGGRV